MKWINMMMPEGVHIEGDTEQATYAELVVAPLERGFGHTLGTALRRTCCPPSTVTQSAPCRWMA